MRVLKGMELEVILNDVAGIMDLPFGDQSSYDQQQQSQEQQQQQQQQQQIQQQHLVPSGGEPWSEDSTSSDPSDLFPWPSELKLAIGGPRKRKLWDVTSSGGVDGAEPPLKVATTPQQQGPGADLRKARERTGRKQDAGCRMGTWQVEDLAGDLDQGLAGLGVDMSSAAYSMRRVYNLDALLALPSLTVFKQEVPSPGNHDQGLVSGGVGEADSSAPSAASQLHQLLQQHGAQLEANGTVGSTTCQGEARASPSVSSSASSSSQQDGVTIDCRFQYVLAAATSIATKVNEETLTYLNQGQSYEIKLKKLGELSAYRGKILKSAIRICFHERRLQYTEREQMAAWQASRPRDRIVEVDVPLSYGVLDVVQDPNALNTVEFLWDPTKEVGIYIKVNCISTEFTPNKHGGEKGVPFRIQVETYLQGEACLKRLHAAACQIKVFKLKGGDRKHKQDREKILKRPPCEQEKFQPSYECTVLNDVSSLIDLYSLQTGTTNHTSIPSESVFSPPMSATVSSSVVGFTTTTDTQVVPSRGSVPSAVGLPKAERSPPPTPNLPVPVANTTQPEQAPLQDLPVYLQPLCSDASAQQTAQWLTTQRFSAYLRTFASFSGADLLRLSRDDLIQICGLPDGIRLFNALHSKSIAPRLTVYLSLEDSPVFHALFLEGLTCAELGAKLATLLGLSATQVQRVYLQGPAGIHVVLSDEVVRNLKDQAMFTIQLIHEPSSEHYRLLLKPASR